MEDIIWVLVAIPVAGIGFWLLGYLIEKKLPAVNLKAILLVSGILLAFYLFTLPILSMLTENYIALVLYVAILNIAAGMLIARPGILYRIRDLLGGFTGKTGAHQTESGKPVFAWGKAFEGDPIPHSMQVKGKKWLHGLLASFFAVTLLVLLSAAINGENITFGDGIFLILFCSFLGALGAYLGRGKDKGAV